MSVENCETAIFTDDSESNEDEPAFTEEHVVAEPIPMEKSIAEPIPMEDSNPDQIVPEMQQHFPGMMKYGAACSNSYVSRIVFGPSDVTLKLDTFDSISIPQDAEFFNDICTLTYATRVLVLVFVKCADNVFNTSDWEKFTSSTTSVILSGKISFESMSVILPSLKNATSMNFDNFHVNRTGSLRESANYVPTSVEKLHFDARGTTDSTFFGNVTVLYERLYTNRHLQIPCFWEVTLIVNDIPGNSSLQTQLSRLAEMLKDESSFAVVITTTRLRSFICNNLHTQGFKRSHDGLIENTNNAMEVFNYWSTKCNGRNIILGLADPISTATSIGKMPLIH